MPQPKINASSNLIMPIALITLLMPLLMIEWPILLYSKGVFIYPLDEAYIRMATAKNIALHSVWGLSAGEFNAASSSLLYPVVLSVLYKLFGVHLIFPFLINLVAAILCIIVVQRWLSIKGMTPVAQTFTLVAFILLTPLPVLVAGGMEHMLQLFFSVLFLIKVCDWFSGGNGSGGLLRSFPWQIFLLGVVLTATRYEGLFIVLPACFFLLMKRKWLPAIVLGVVSILPLLIFGIYSLGHGAYFFPTSLMIKAIPAPLDEAAIHKFFIDDISARLIYTYSTAGAVAAARLLIVLPLLYWWFLGRMKEQATLRYFLLCCLRSIPSRWSRLKDRSR